LTNRESELAAVSHQLEEVSPIMTLRHGIDDSVLSNLIAKAEEVDWKALKERVVLSEQPNPLYASLVSRKVDLDILVQSLAALRLKLPQDIDKVREKIGSLSTALVDVRGKLQSAHSAQDLLLFKQKELSRLKISLAEQRRADRLAARMNYNENQVLQLDRSIQPFRDYVRRLNEDWNSLQQAKSTIELVDLRIGASAVEPTGPVARKSALFAGIGMFFGMGFGLLLALIIKIRKDGPAMRTGGES
jgi:chromosome segregation ATPase